MKQIFSFLLFLLSCKCYAQAGQDSIIGKWLKTPKEDLVIEVYKSADEYKGKIVWSKDSANFVGFPILEGLKYNEKKRLWSGGKVRNPKSGSTYNANAKIKSDGTLEVLAYKGMKFINRKKYFKRVT